MSANLTGAERPTRLEFLAVSPDYFSLLGAQPEIGRLIDRRDVADPDEPAGGSLSNGHGLGGSTSLRCLANDRIDQWLRRLDADVPVVEMGPPVDPRSFRSLDLVLQLGRPEDLQEATDDELEMLREAPIDMQLPA